MTKKRAELDDLLDWSISGHGYLLINYRSLIADDLTEALHKHGYEATKLRLEDWDDPLHRLIYAKIHEHRDREAARCSETGCGNKRQGRTTWCWAHMTAWTREHLVGSEAIPHDEVLA